MHVFDCLSHITLGSTCMCGVCSITCVLYPHCTLLTLFAPLPLRSPSLPHLLRHPPPHTIQHPPPHTIQHTQGIRAMVVKPQGPDDKSCMSTSTAIPTRSTRTPTPPPRQATPPLPEYVVWGECAGSHACTRIHTQRKPKTCLYVCIPACTHPPAHAPHTHTLHTLCKHQIPTGVQPRLLHWKDTHEA